MFLIKYIIKKRKRKRKTLAACLALVLFKTTAVKAIYNAKFNGYWKAFFCKVWCNIIFSRGSKYQQWEEANTNPFLPLLLTLFPLWEEVLWVRDGKFCLKLKCVGPYMAYNKMYSAFEKNKYTTKYIRILMDNHITLYIIN